MTGPTSRTTQTQTIEALDGIDKLLAVVARLRDPDGGCPWDLKQTHASLKPYMLEEAYEAVEAVEFSDRPELLREELGDVLLQVALHAQLADDAGQYNFQDVSRGIADKLIRRHPHVFGDEVTVSGADEVTSNWQAIKAAEKAERGDAPKTQSILEGVPKGTPALSRALDTSKRAVKVGFEWPNLDSLWDCVMSEYDEFRAEVDADSSHDKLEDEMGDILFATVNLARYAKIDPEVALTRATTKFTRRFQAMEAILAERHGDRPLDELQSDPEFEALDFEAWDALWNEAKRRTS